MIRYLICTLLAINLCQFSMAQDLNDNGNVETESIIQAQLSFASFVNTAPVLQAIANVSIEENQVSTVSLSASDAESIAGAVWSFPAGLPTFISFKQIDDASGQLVIKPFTGNVGVFTIVVKVQDADGAFDTKSFTVTVVPEPLNGGVAIYFSDKGLLAGSGFKGGDCNGVYELQWQMSLDGISNFTDIMNGVSANFLPQSTSKYYRLKITCNSSIVYSNVVFVTPVTVSLSPNNYVKSFNIVGPGVTQSVIVNELSLQEGNESIQYLDGLGRPSQLVARKGSLTTGSAATDIVTPLEYDAFGRTAIKYLPFAASGSNGNISIDDGKFKSQAITLQQSFYSDPNGLLKGQGETYFYSKTEYEASPLNRVVKEMAPGNSWTGSNRGAELKYWLNTTDDDVKIWQVTNVPGGWGTYIVTGNYQPGELYKSVTINEHNKQVIEFKDKMGKVLLKKVQLITTVSDNGNGKNYDNWLCTYYLYDDRQQLRLVIQPEGINLLLLNNWDITSLNGDILNEQCFRYEYNVRGLLIKKKVPGSGEDWMVYDTKDRLVMWQNAILRNNHQWKYFMYDGLGREYVNGLLIDNTNYNNHSYHLSQAAMIVTYPSLSSYTTEELVRTYYGSYSWTSALSNELKTFDASYANPYLLPASNSTWPYPQALINSDRSLGLKTGYQVKILGSNPAAYITTILFYDEIGRVIQVRSTNITSGVDVSTTQYSWIGLPLINVFKQSKAGSVNQQEHILVTKSDYDDLGRMVKVRKEVKSVINGIAVSSLEKETANYEYNALGQLKRKTIAPYGGPAGGSLEILDHEYNIRGWLLGVNRDEMLTTNNGSRYFGFELGYDKTVNKAGHNFLTGQYNGNINGLVWNSKGGATRRKYDFSYDLANRLLSAAFVQDNGNSYWANNEVNFDVLLGDGTDPLLAYDANGNIKRMQQYGAKVNTSQQIDDLTYEYFNHGSKLKAVTENGPGAVNHHLGDFTDNNTTAIDYGYDLNGNLVTDLNKRINGVISYNYLNLPILIPIKKDDGSDRGSISYVYDADGNKLQKIVEDKSVVGKITTTTTTYIGSLVYESKQTNTSDPGDYTDKLQLISHEEGRIRFIASTTTGGVNYPARYEYDYFLKDHIGNVRMVLTEEDVIDAYPQLTFEGTVGSNGVQDQDNHWENKTGGSIDVTNTRVGKHVLFGDNATNGDYAMLVKKSTGAIGATKLLKVMAGDKVHTSVEYFYTAINANNSPASGINSLVASFLSSLNTSSVVTDVLKSQASEIVYNFSGDPYLAILLNTPANKSGTNQAPKAYLNVLFFDERFFFDKNRSLVIPVAYLQNQKGIIEKRFANAINITKNGYIYLYFSNESEEVVYFDNFMLSHEKGRILEETHYYPFGLTMAGISSKAISPDYVENKNKFNGIELNTDLDLSVYDAQYRNLDPQLGRFWQADPKPTEMESLYSAMGNNPILYSDPLGDTLALPNARIEFVQYFANAFFGLESRGAPNLLRQLMNSTAKINIVEYTGYNGSWFDHRNNTIYWNPTLGLETTRGIDLSPATILNHEADHALQFVNKREQYLRDLADETIFTSYDNEEEKRIIKGSEQLTAIAMGETTKEKVTRKDHTGENYIITSDPMSTKGRRVNLESIEKAKLKDFVIEGQYRETQTSISR